MFAVALKGNRVEGSPMRHGRRSGETPLGFTYLILLFSIAIIGIGLATTGVIWSTESRLAKEKELDAIGLEFVNAIESYYNGTPGEVKSYPPTLDDLVSDSRFLLTKRHLRKLYPNPLTGKANWNIVPAAQGGIQGIRVDFPNKKNGNARLYIFIPSTQKTPSR